VPAGAHTFVLSLSGETDNYGGWARALHNEAQRPDDTVRVQPSQVSTVAMRLTLGPPAAIERT